MHAALRKDFTRKGAGRDCNRRSKAGTNRKFRVSVLTAIGCRADQPAIKAQAHAPAMIDRVAIAAINCTTGWPVNDVV